MKNEDILDFPLDNNIQDYEQPIWQKILILILIVSIPSIVKLFVFLIFPTYHRLVVFIDSDSEVMDMIINAYWKALLFWGIVFFMLIKYIKVSIKLMYIPLAAMLLGVIAAVLIYLSFGSTVDVQFLTTNANIYAEISQGAIRGAFVGTFLTLIGIIINALNKYLNKHKQG